LRIAYLEQPQKRMERFLRGSPAGVRHRDMPNKLRSARLAWPLWRANAGHPISVNRP
jgi:hypothetical protein